MALNGNYFGLYVGVQRIALTKSNDVSIKRSFDDITSKDSNGFKEVLAAMLEANGSMEGVFTSSLVNKLQFPEDFSNAIWSKGAATVSGTKIEAVNGQKLGQTITWNAATEIKQTLGSYFIIGNYVTFSIWIKGSGTVTISTGDDDDSTTSSTITLTSTWTRYEVTHVLTTSVDVFVSITKTSGTAVSFCYPQLEISENATTYKGSLEMFTDLQTISENRTKVTLIHTSNIDGDLALNFDGYITDLALKTSNDKANTFSCNFESTGAITKTTI